MSNPARDPTIYVRLSWPEWYPPSDIHGIGLRVIGPEHPRG